MYFCLKQVPESTQCSDYTSKFAKISFGSQGLTGGLIVAVMRSEDIVEVLTEFDIALAIFHLHSVSLPMIPSDSSIS